MSVQDPPITSPTSGSATSVLHGLAKVAKNLNSLQRPTPVSTLPTPEKAPSTFVARQTHLNNLHAAIIQNEDEMEPLKKMVILTGPQGIGKSWAAKKYAEIHANYHQQNVWWIGAESAANLENCFESLARHFKIPQMTLDHMVVNVYRHFSTHVKKGLFIFDGLNSKEGETPLSKIEKFLPIEPLENLPHFLVTSNSKFWYQNDPGKTTEEKQDPKFPIIEIDGWTVEESVEFLKNALNFENIKKGDDQNNEESIEIVLHEFGGLFGGFPLALNLIAASISLDLDPLACFDEHAKEVEHKIRANVQDFKNSENFLQTEDDTSFQKLENMAEQIWHRILNRMRRRPDANSKMAVELFNIMAYLPTDRIGVEICHSIHNFIENTNQNFEETGEKFSIKPLESTKNDPEVPIQKTEVWHVLQMLEKVGLVTIFEQDYYKFEGRYWLRCHSLVQKWTRQILKDQQKPACGDNSIEYESGANFYLTKLADYLESTMGSIPPIYYNRIVDHLKENGWPVKTYCLHLCSIVKKNMFNFYQLDRKKDDLLELLKLFKKKMPSKFYTRQNNEEGDLDFFNWFKMTLVYYQDGKPFTDLDGSGQTLGGQEVLNPAPFFEANEAAQGQGDHDDDDELFRGKKIKIEEFLEWTLDQVAKYPDNFQIHLVALDVVGDLWKILVNNEKLSIKIMNWVHAFLNAVQSQSRRAQIGGEAVRRFLKIVNESGFIPVENLMRLAFAALEARVGGGDDDVHHGNFDCWQFFWNTLKCIEDWPHGIWIEAVCSNMAVKSLENGAFSCSLFLSSGGLDILTKLLRSQNSATINPNNDNQPVPKTDGMNLVIERIISLIYFDEFVSAVLAHEDFKDAFEIAATAAHDTVVNASKYILKCKSLGTLDRMLITIFSIFVKNRRERSSLWTNGFNLKNMECCHFMYDKLSQFLLTLGISERRVVVDFLWFKWETRMVILDSFLESSRNQSKFPVSRPASSLHGLAVKLQQFSSLLQ